MFLVAALAVTGASQMPIFKRYYIAEVPGLGWTAKYYLTHKLHYVGAIGMLFLAGCLLSMHFGQWRRRYQLRPWAWPRLGLIAVVLLTGVVRVLKNLPGVTFEPTTVMIVDWAHLLATVLWGILALFLAMTRRSAYYVRK